MKHVSLFGMALVRIMSGSAEILAAVYILKKGSLHTALRVNAALGLAGPVALLLATAFGATALRTELKPAKMAILLLGVLLIAFATR